MKVGVLFSGGKDSCLALHKFGIEKIDCLLSLIPENLDSFMFHKPDLKLLKKQAEMLGKKLIIKKTSGKENLELKDLESLIKKSKVNKLVIGGIKSCYQGERIKKICFELGVEVIAPLWNYGEDKLWGELLKNNFKVIITKIASEGISKDFLGKIIDEKTLEKLKKLAQKYKFRLDFEGGEAETSVLFMPGFSKEIRVSGAMESEGDYRHFLKLKEVF